MTRQLNASAEARKLRPRQRSDVPFFIVMGGLSAIFILLIVLLLVADVMFTSTADFKAALLKPEIRSAFRLTILSCTLATILSIWVATPLGYVLSRYRFPGRWLIDTLVDIPIVLPPLVLGLSLLILFHLPFGGGAPGAEPQEREVRNPVVHTPADRQDVSTTDAGAASRDDSKSATETDTRAGAKKSDGDTLAATEETPPWKLETWLRDDLDFPVTYHWRAVVLAQFAVACAFAVRTMRVTFDQINPRVEDVARTLGCTRGQAFLQIALPQAWRGMIAAATISWARALGEFGPILVFAGATRGRTEVLSTSVFLELSIGHLDAAVAVSLLMVLMAVIVLVILRLVGTGLSA